MQAKLELEWRDPDILVPAIDLLEAERAIHLSVAEKYGQFRRRQKADGYRFPPRTHVTPRDPIRWHGDERLGARHLLLHWSRRPNHIWDDPGPQAVGRVVVEAVERSLVVTPTPEELRELQPVLDWARRQIHVVGWETDRVQYRLAWSTYRLLGQLHVLTQGATAVAEPWGFLPAANRSR
ncbi:hypothetical protein [Calidifontibacter indicus]|uniref:hypothetical protein n=1 Tax=Calidifontibacter indicus TaxID=419650 RepID=UPI003D708F72